VSEALHDLDPQSYSALLKRKADLVEKMKVKSSLPVEDRGEHNEDYLALCRGDVKPVGLKIDKRGFI
jgi:hypothetical protein